jgi:hypothetical protein
MKDARGQQKAQVLTEKRAGAVEDTSEPTDPVNVSQIIPHATSQRCRPI